MGPQGPRYPYQNGEPTISDMASNVDQVEIYGEWDHESVARSTGPSVGDNHSQFSYQSNKTTTKYHSVYNKYQQPQQQQPGYLQPFQQKKVEHRKKMKMKKRNNGQFREKDQVYYEGQQYEVVAVCDDKLMIANDVGNQYYLPQSKYHKLSHV